MKELYYRTLTRLSNWIERKRFQHVKREFERKRGMLPPKTVTVKSKPEKRHW